MIRFVDVAGFKQAVLFTGRAQDIVDPSTPSKIWSRSLRASRRRRGGDLTPWKQHALIKIADSDQHEPQTDKRQRAPDTGEICHVNQEYFGDRQPDYGGRGEARRFRIDDQPNHEQHHPEREPYGRGGIALRITDGTSQPRPSIRPSDL